MQECQKEIKFDAFMKLITDTAKLAAALVTPTPEALGALASVGKAFNIIGALATESVTFSQQYWVSGDLWNPNTQLPPPPNLNAEGGFENQTYADASYQWYLEAQQNVSESLVTMSTARWDSIYLENEEQIAPSEL